MNQVDITQQIRSEDAAVRLAVLDRAPAVAAQRAARADIEAAAPARQFEGWQAVVGACLEGGAPAYAAQVVVALADWFFDAAPDDHAVAAVSLPVVGRLSAAAARGLHESGAYEEAIAFAGRSGPRRVKLGRYNVRAGCSRWVNQGNPFWCWPFRTNAHLRSPARPCQDSSTASSGSPAIAFTGYRQSPGNPANFKLPIGHASSLQEKAPFLLLIRAVRGVPVAAPLRP